METQRVWGFKALPEGAASTSLRGQVHHRNSPAPAPWRAPGKPIMEKKIKRGGVTPLPIVPSGCKDYALITHLYSMDDIQIFTPTHLL